MRGSVARPNTRIRKPTRAAADDAIRLLYEIVAHASPPGGLSTAPIRPLTNITFWCGAGFAKSWNRLSPTGAQLFECPMRRMRNDHLDVLRDAIGYDHGEKMTLARVKDLMYALDMYAQYPAIRPRYLDG